MTYPILHQGDTVTIRPYADQGGREVEACDLVVNRDGCPIAW